MNAGSASALMSLWSIDDCMTSVFMKHYYENLRDGQSKNQALQKAKIHYLQTVSKDKQHPYYWAAFITYGDMNALDFNQSFPSGYILGLGLLLLIMAMFFFSGLGSKRK